MRKERIIWVSIIAFLILALLINFNQQYSRADESTEKNFIKIFEMVYNNLRFSYIDEKEPKDLIVGAINGMIKTLDDPHTALLEPKAKEDLEIETSGQYGGLGIEVGIKDNKLVVIAPMEDTPAEKAGVQAGDKIIKINNEPVINPDLNLIVNKLRGKPDTEVTLSIERENNEGLINITIKREIIEMKSVKSQIFDNIAYVRLIAFRKNAAEELKNALEDIHNKKVKGIILDLRNNPGGLLEAAVKIANFFIKDGLLVYTKPRESAGNYYNMLNRKFLADKDNVVVDKEPLVVLINGGSASASEILAGAIKDRQRGILVGTTSFGKGSVQSVINLDMGYGLRFTTAYYYTPNGIKIHKKGIKPDIEVDLPKVTRDDIKYINKLKNDKIIEKFVTDHKEIQVQDIDTLMDSLKQQDIILSKMIVKKLILQEQYKNKQEPLIDLDFDTQLKMAYQLLKAQSVFSATNIR